MRKTAFIFVVAVAISISSYAGDKQGSKDHPLFTRMPGYYIENYKENEFDSYDFPTGRGREYRATVEGRLTKIDYRLIKGGEKPSASQVVANYTAAIRRIGGSVIFEDKLSATMKVAKDEKEIWALVRVSTAASNLDLIIVEKDSMKQKVVANADILANDLAATGHVAIYGIYFETGKADVKPESEAAIDEIAKLIGQNPSLRLHLVGHTDNVGDTKKNMELSKARAEAVMKVLVTRHRISQARLNALGIGPYAPVASNNTDDGRAKNRRVELVEQ